MSWVAPDSVPVKVEEPEAPLFNVIPPGSDPDVFAIETESVAVKVIVPIFAAPENVPKLPADVCQAGASDTVSIADVWTALPSGFSTYNK